PARVREVFREYFGDVGTRGDAAVLEPAADDRAHSRRVASHAEGVGRVTPAQVEGDHPIPGENGSGDALQLPGRRDSRRLLQPGPEGRWISRPPKLGEALRDSIV